MKKSYAFTLHQKSRKERRTATEPLGALDTCPLKFVGTIAGKVNLQVEWCEPPRTAECGLHLQSFLGLKHYGVLWEVTRLGSFESNLPKKTAYSISSCPAERTWKRCKTWNLEGAKIRGGVLHLPENAALGVPHWKGVSGEPSKHPPGEAAGIWELTADYSCASQGRLSAHI